LKNVIGLSKQEVEEAQALRIALQASLELEQERIAALGLGLKATANLVRTSVSQQETKAKDDTNATWQDCLNERDTPSVNTLKVVRGCDVRRLRAQWSSDALVGEILSCLTTTVEKGFGLSMETDYVLKYHDDEGDLCTLVEETILDFFHISRQSSMKLILNVETSASSSDSSKHCGCSENDVSLLEEGFSIATPPESPRSHLSETIELDYEASWDIIEHAS